MQEVQSSSDASTSLPVSCELIHCSASASSKSHTLLWLPPPVPTTVSTATAVAGTKSHVQDCDKDEDENGSGSGTLIYSSYSTVNLASEAKISTQHTLPHSHQKGVHSQERHMKVNQTLRRKRDLIQDDMNNADDLKVKCLCHVRDYNTVLAAKQQRPNEHATAVVPTKFPTLACGISSGAIHVWWGKVNNSKSADNVNVNANANGLFEYQEEAVPHCERSTYSDMAGIENIPVPMSSQAMAIVEGEGSATAATATATCTLLVTSSSKGVVLHSKLVTATTPAQNSTAEDTITKCITKWSSQKIAGHGGSVSPAVACVKLQVTSQSHPHSPELLLLTGSAAPKGNRITVYLLYPGIAIKETETQGLWSVCAQGNLLGHQDWITCMDTTQVSVSALDSDNDGDDMLLASGSHDNKIRLWKFHSYAYTAAHAAEAEEEEEEEVETNNTSASENDLDVDDTMVDDLYEDAARVMIRHQHENRNRNRDAVTDAPNDNTTATSTLDLDVTGQRTAITLEALLFGHDDIVTSVSWHPASSMANSTQILLSSSMDRSILIWCDDVDEGVWVPTARMGSAGGIIGASVGSSLLGFKDARWSPSGNAIVGHAHGGSLYFWRAEWDDANDINKDKDVEGAEEGEGDIMIKSDRPPALAKANDNNSKNNKILSASWMAHPPLTGHFQEANDICWEPSRGEYLLSVSSDQTCRLWTELPLLNNCEETACPMWQEVARPQVHGYDLTSVCCIGVDGDKGNEPRHRFVSCADEKQLRVFDAPTATIDLLRQLHHGDAHGDTDDNDDDNDLHSDMRVSKAFLPSLGLTNKAGDTYDEITQMEMTTDTNTSDVDGEAEASTGGRGKLKLLPLPYERELGVSTLWPGKSLQVLEYGT
jgi:WD40 repeat protein